MEINKLSIEELQTMSYADLAYLIIKEAKKKKNTAELFKKICELLNLNEKAYEDKIADFFTLLLTDKRFIQLDKGFWDLKENHKVKIDMDELESESDEEDEEIVEETDEVEEDDYLDDSKDIDDDPEEDDLKDLVIIDEDSDEDGLI